MKIRSREFWVSIGIVACFVFVAFDLGMNIWFAHDLPKYDWLTESMSRLGQTGSPIEGYVTIWGFCFAFLLLLFANAFRLIVPPCRATKLAAIAIVVYALGEGIGSGLFPIDPLKAATTIDGTLHEALSGIGDAGIILLPFILLRIDNFKTKPRFINYIIFAIVTGLSLLILFLIAKYIPGATAISDYKGLWQRIYALNYHIMLLILNFQMLAILNKKKTLTRK